MTVRTLVRSKMYLVRIAGRGGEDNLAFCRLFDVIEHKSHNQGRFMLIRTRALATSKSFEV